MLLFFFTFSNSIVCVKNSKESQVTILEANFIRKSYENLFTVRGELTPFPMQHNRAELLGGQEVLSGLQKNQFHATAPFDQGKLPSQES